VRPLDVQLFAVSLTSVTLAPAQGLETPHPIMRIDGQELIGSYEEETTAMLFGDRTLART
jgi:hypothetical protein